MIEYYTDLNGNYYRLICVAHSNGMECGKIVVYQQLNETGNIIATSSCNDDFKKVDAEEALKKCPEYLKPQYHFPFIRYQKEMPLMQDPNDDYSSRVQGMITLHRNTDYPNLQKAYLFDALKKKNDDGIEEEALRRIKAYTEGDNIEEIFHLIQTWGGSSGRGIYLFGNGFNWNSIEPQYMKLVSMCLETTDTSVSSINKLVDLIKETKIPHLGISFITKHTRFWLYNKLGENALPIYDSIMAMEIMRKNVVSVNDLADYWKVMVAKAKRENISLMSLERQIFLHVIDIR